MSPRLICSQLGVNIDCILRMRRNIGNLQKQMNEMERRMIDRKQKLHLPSVILVKNIVILNDLVTAPGRDRSLSSCKQDPWRMHPAGAVHYKIQF